MAARSELSPPKGGSGVWSVQSAPWAITSAVGGEVAHDRLDGMELRPGVGSI